MSSTAQATTIFMQLEMSPRKLTQLMEAQHLYPWPTLPIAMVVLLQTT
jgi:hypothetical protein